MEIFTFNTIASISYPLMNSEFSMSYDEVYKTIKEHFGEIIVTLKNKGVDYCKLKRDLIPNQDKDNNEVCLIFDSSLIEDMSYGYEIFSKLLSLLDKESTYSILAGDYINISKLSEEQLYKMLQEKMIICNSSTYLHNNQYYIYINSITNSQIFNIVENLKKYEYFSGYMILNNNSFFKSYLSIILGSTCIKAKDFDYTSISVRL